MKSKQMMKYVNLNLIIIKLNNFQKNFIIKFKSIFLISCKKYYEF